MKKLFFVYIAFLFIINPCVAQSNPSLWQTFINSEANYLVSDTFRFQGFESSSKDNWGYQASDNVSLFDISGEKIKGQGGKYSMKLPLDSWILLDSFATNFYLDHVISLSCGAQHLSQNEKLNATYYRNGERKESPVLPYPKDGPEDYSTSKMIAFNIKDRPSRFQLKVTEPTENTKNGFCFIDSLYISGNIPIYSLFTGEGDWNDTLRWSHLPPARHRNALIQGRVTVNNAASCHSVRLFKGGLQVSAGASLEVDNLILHGEDLSLYSPGDIKVDSAVTFQKTFEEKGKWYFISFPFDVYPTGIDPAFALKDDQEKGNGNYFYVQEYDSGKRAEEGSKASNWKVLEAGNRAETPLFRKNTGYLIALDAGADRQTMSFTSTNIPSGFASGGIAPIKAGFGNHTEDSGWFLCGNPLPSPLSLKRIAGNNALAPFIWVFNGKEYQSYPIDSNYALPPFSAFFVKAEEETSLVIAPETATTEKSVLIPTGYPLVDPKAEPVSTERMNVNTERVYYHLPYLYLSGLAAYNHIFLFDMKGRLFYHKEIDSDDFTLYLPLQKGFYILRLESGQKKVSHKFAVGASER